MLTTSFYPDVGGAEFLSAELAKGLVNNGLRVIFLAREKSLPYPAWEGTPHIDFRPVIATVGIAGFVKSIFKVFRGLAGEHFEILHAHFALTPGLIALPLAFLRKVPLVVTSPGSDIIAAEKTAYGRILRATDSILTRIVLRFSSAHVILCQAMLPHALASGSDPAKVHVIYPGVHDPSAHVSYESYIPQFPGLDRTNAMILFVGRLVKKKAAEDLVKATPWILEALPHAKIIIAGDGPERVKLTKMARELAPDDRISFPGTVTEDERYALLERCNVFVIPSTDAEGMPHILLEAIAFAKPIVATNIPPFREVLAQTSTAVLVPVNSPEALAKGIITLAERFRHHVREEERPRNMFGIERMVKGYTKLYHEILARAT
jgi:glycosyltransferase involved in cell wall biosynthesis